MMFLLYSHMKRTLSMLACLGMAISWASIGSSRAEERSSKPEMTAEEAISALGKKDPVFLDALPPPEIPEAVTTYAAGWMRRVIREKWLPGDIEQRFLKIKDLRKLELFDKNGVLFSKWEGDYVAIRYPLQGHDILLQENGLYISVWVKSPDKAPEGGDINAWVAAAVDRFLCIPEAAAKTRKPLILDHTGPIYHGRLLHGDEKLNEWWQQVWVCTDGHFIFMSVVELDGKPRSPQARPGLPDRF